MRISAAFVTAVLIWSAARYLPPYYLELHKMDLEEEKTVVQQKTANAMLREMRLQTRLQMTPSKARLEAPNESHLY
jgi:hypothetical protein